MPVISLFGRMLPSSIKITYSKPPQITIHDNGNNIDMLCSVSVVDSEITARFELPKMIPNFLPSLNQLSMDMARGLVDLYAFAQGQGIFLLFDRFQIDEGKVEDFTLSDPSLPSLCTSFKLNSPDFENVLKYVMTDPRTFMSLNDLILSITLPHHAPVNCARAMEGIRRIIVAPSAPDKEAWVSMQETLNFDMPYMTLLTDAAKDPRHGNRTWLSSSTGGEITKRSWTIMNRFFEYLKRGSLPLPIDEFPMLRG